MTGVFPPSEPHTSNVIHLCEGEGGWPYTCILEAWTKMSLSQRLRNNTELHHSTCDSEGTVSALSHNTKGFMTETSCYTVDVHGNLIYA